MRPYAAETYALLRIVVGFLFLWHGAQKLFGFPAPMMEGAPAFIIWIAGPIELIGGFLVMIGLMTRWAAFLASGLMAAAYFMAHAFSKVGEMGFVGLAPMNNGGEIAVLYCFVFLYIAANGAGIWSVDGSGELATGRVPARS
jgi:putative oxidoreductase